MTDGESLVFLYIVANKDYYVCRYPHNQALVSLQATRAARVKQTCAGCGRGHAKIHCQGLIVSNHRGDTYVLCSSLAGIKDAFSVNPDLTLGDVGIDSLMVVEIQQALERNYHISMAAKDIRALTFASLDQLSTSGQQPAAGNAASETIG